MVITPKASTSHFWYLGVGVGGGESPLLQIGTSISYGVAPRSFFRVNPSSMVEGKGKYRPLPYPTSSMDEVQPDGRKHQAIVNIT